MSWQHLTFVTSFIVVMVICAIVLGRRNRTASTEQKNRVLVVTAILIDAIELFKIVVMCIGNHDPLYFVNVLPLFLCSIQLISIPMAAFCKGRMKKAALDFVQIFGLLGAILGTYCAGNNFSCYPILGFDNIVSVTTHTIAGFASLYIMISGMSSMEKRDIPITAAVLAGFCVAAYVANVFWDCNYMFLSRGDGTPYDIVYNLVNGNQVLYPLCVVGLFVLYINLYYHVYYAITSRSSKNMCRAEEACVRHS